MGTTAHETRAALAITANCRSTEDLSRSPRLIGLENEYVLTRPDGSMAPRGALAALWSALADRGWELIVDPGTREVTGAKRAGPRTVRGRPGNDLVTTDFGYATLEVNVAPAVDLHRAGGALVEILDLVTGILARHGTRLLGYGVQPVTPPRPGQLGPGTRYRQLTLARSAEEGGPPDGGTDNYLCLSASSQAQVDVSAQECVGVVNALNATAGLRVVLLANSPVWQGRVSPHQALRELFWDWWWPSRRGQVGIPPQFTGTDDYARTLLGFRPLLVRRDDGHLLLDGPPSFGAFLASPSEVAGRYPDGTAAKVRSTAQDFLTHSGFGWFTTRPHPLHGTVEDRVACQQPPWAALSAPALTLGLVENHAELGVLAARLPLEQWRELRLRACTSGFGAELPGVDVVGLVTALLDLAEAGLRSRGRGEEVHLAPLRKSLAARTNPAGAAARAVAERGVPALVDLLDMRNLTPLPEGRQSK